MGKYLVTPKTLAMRDFMQEIAGGHKMRLQKELERVTAMKISCTHEIYASATTQDDYGRIKSDSRMCALVDNKALADLALFRKLKTLHLNGYNKNANLYPHKWPDSIENLIVENYELFAGLVPYLERLVNLKRLSVAARGRTIELPQKVKERLEFFCCTNVEDYSFLEGCTKLEELEIISGRAASMSTIPALPALKTLKLPLFGGCTLDGIERLTALEYLNVTNGGVADISALAKLKKLNTIGLASNHISDISALAKLPLQTLDISSNMIEDISPLAGQEGLLFLEIAHNPIVDLTPISGCTAMELLHLQDTWVEDISPLFGMKELEELCLDIRPIKDKEQLKGLSEVKTVNGKYFVDFIKRIKQDCGE